MCFIIRKSAPQSHDNWKGVRVGTYLHWPVVTSIQLNVGLGKKAMSKGGREGGNW